MKLKEIKIAHYKIFFNKKLGSGGFGDIFFGQNLKTSEDIAVKIEASKSDSQLKLEAQFLNLLKGGEGIPKIHYFLSTSQFNFMIIDLLGPSLDILFDHFRNNIDIRTLMLIFKQMLMRIEFIHSRHIIHRDVKPENFLIGIKSNSHIVYLIDYGLAKVYRDMKSGEHIKYKDGKELTGTARYASIFTHLGIEQSRRDDLECLGFSIIYLYKGRLPWQGLKVKNSKEKNRQIMNKKLKIRLSELCDGLPYQIERYFEYVRALIFDEKPDYSYLHLLIDEVIQVLNINEDYVYEWNRKK